MQWRKCSVIKSVWIPMFLLLLGIGGCVFPEDSGSRPAAANPATAAPLPAAAQEPPRPGSGDLYAEELPPLTPAECGRCHPTVFGSLREAGGNHKFQCQDCHQNFHVVDKDAARPVCSTCHSQPHPESFSACLTCHENPHAPRRIPATAVLTDNCGQCHETPVEELQTFPSAHAEQECNSCHSGQHGALPSCLECHDPHYTEQQALTCGGCHFPHKPLLITFAVDLKPQTCQECHAQVYATWTGTPSRHGQVNCTNCHSEHGLTPNCTDCHQQPHSERILTEYPNCLTCHLDAHDPPVKSKN